MKRHIIITMLLAWFSVAYTQDSWARDTSAAMSDSAAAASVDSLEQAESDATQQQGPRKLKIVKRKHTFREQIALALFMMGFVALAMTTAQSWNPR